MSARRLTALTGLFLIGALAACQAAPSPSPSAAPPAATLAPSATTPPADTASPNPTATTAPTEQVAAGQPTVTPAVSSSGGGQAAGPRPVPCNINGGEEVYLVIAGQRRHIIDLDTFTNLGYKPADIAPCGDSASLPEGGPISRLIKGSGDPVYFMENGLRRHIPNMATLAEMGYPVSDISTLPDSVVNAWPLGQPEPTIAGSPTLPTACTIGGGQDIYLIIGGQRRPLADSSIQYNLGYAAGQIQDCGASASLPVGAPITKVFKGSGDTIYLMVEGQRHAFPDMATFTEMGYTPADITTLPDDVLADWSVGDPEPRLVDRSALPQACTINGGLEIYLIIDSQRRHVVDATTFGALGYQQSNIQYCGASAFLPEGGPITRLIKGSADTVYYMDEGARHAIPDMATLTAMGFTAADITTLADSVVNLWPLGDPLQPRAPSAPYKTITIAEYTISLFHPGSGQGMFDWAILSHTGQPDIKIEDVDSVATPPAADITGDGQPDVVFNIRSVGSGHCCWGTILYNLGSSPERLLDIGSNAYDAPGTGQGTFQDLNGDGVYEFITADSLSSLGCSSGTTVGAILRFDSGSRHYVGATPQFASYYDGLIAQLTASTQPGDVCAIFPLITQLLYVGRDADAKAAFDKLYNGSDPGGDWARIQKAVVGNRFYVAGH